MIVFFNDTATPEIYTLSLHDALPICGFAVRYERRGPIQRNGRADFAFRRCARGLDFALPHVAPGGARSEEHTSELQSRQYLVCRLLLEKKTSMLGERRRSSEQPS